MEPQRLRVCDQPRLVFRATGQRKYFGIFVLHSLRQDPLLWRSLALGLQQFEIIFFLFFFIFTVPNMCKNPCNKGSLVHLRLHLGISEVMSTMHCTTHHCTVIHITVLYCTAHHHTTLHITVLLYTALHCACIAETWEKIELMHCSWQATSYLEKSILHFALHCTALYCIVMLCTAWYTSLHSKFWACIAHVRPRQCL